MATPLPTPKNAKTHVLITLKSGDERNIFSPDDVETLILGIAVLMNRPSWGFKDVDGSMVIINATEYETINLIPMEP